MKKFFPLLTILLLSSTLFAQKVKIKNDIASVDGIAYVKWVTKNLGNEMSVYALDSENEDIFISFQSYHDHNKVSSSNPEGTVKWVEFNFISLNIKCEISSRFQKGIVKALFNNSIYVDGKFNIENAKKMVDKYGTKFSSNKPVHHH